MKDTDRDAKYIEAILDYISEIEDFMQGVNSATELDSDTEKLRAVSFNLEHLGENAWKISDEFKSAHPDIAFDYSIKMRHLLVHSYERADTKIIYDTIKEDLPVLMDKLKPFDRRV